MSYRNGLNYLGSKTRVIELCNQLGARLVVCPEWNGRVMTSSCDGLDGASFGLINVKEIDSAEIDRSFGFYGGEDQFTLSPEGGPFSLYYATNPEAKAITSDHIQLPVGFQEGPFKVDSLPHSPEVRMRRNLQMTNIAGAHFDLDIVRTVRLQESEDIRSVFGSAVTVSLEQTDVSYVAFATINAVINRGMPHSKLSGLVSVRIRSMFNSSQHTVAVVPFRPGKEEELGPPVCADFFGSAPHGRLRLLPQAALLRADSKYRCQIGVSRKRALPFVGSVDFREGILTLVAFDMPQPPWKHDYLSNAYCETVGNTVADFVNAREFYVAQADRADTKVESEKSISASEDEETPYSGEVVRAYNHGPAYPGEIVSGQFYEFDVFSSTRELNKGDSLVHHQYTIHINADNRTLAYIADKVLGIDYEQAYRKMMN